MVVPDYVQAFVGWRVWSAAGAPDAAVLTSLTRPQPWPVGRELAACCVRAPAGAARPPHVAPAVDCACGVHAYTSEADAVRLLDQARQAPGALAAVVGRVSLWGRVVVHQHGWRGAFAYPLDLFVPSRWCGGIRAADAAQVADALRRYGVPVAVVPAATMDGFLEAVALDVGQRTSRPRTTRDAA